MTDQAKQQREVESPVKKDLKDNEIDFDKVSSELIGPALDPIKAEGARRFKSASVQTCFAGCN